MALDLEAIEARVNAATPGPWCADYGSISTFYNRDTADFIVGQTSDDGVGPANAEFMAEARQDIPALIAEVRRLKRQLTDALEVALTPEHRYSTEAVDALLAACESVDLNKYDTDAIGCGFGPVLDAMEAVRASREPAK